MAVSRISGIKFLELVLTLTCVVLHYKSLAETDHHTIMLASGTFVGYSIILIGLFVSYIISAPLNKSIDSFFSLVGCALFIATGVLIIQYWEDSLFKTETRKYALAKGSLAIINGVLFLFDVFFVYRS